MSNDRKHPPKTKKRRQPDFTHHYRDDLACPACGTDSSVGCIK